MESNEDGQTCSVVIYFWFNVDPPWPSMREKRISTHQQSFSIHPALCWAHLGYWARAYACSLVCLTDRQGWRHTLAVFELVPRSVPVGDLVEEDDEMSSAPSSTSLVCLNLEWLIFRWFPVAKPFLFLLFRPASILLCLFLCLCQSHPGLILLRFSWFHSATGLLFSYVPSGLTRLQVFLVAQRSLLRHPVLSLICCWWSHPASHSLLFQVSHSSVLALLVPSCSSALHQPYVR